MSKQIPIIFSRFISKRAFPTTTGGRAFNKNWCISEVPLTQYKKLPAPRDSVRLRLVHSVAVSVGRRLQLSYRSSDFSCKNRYYSILEETTRKMPEGKPFERLPGTVKPKHYRLSLVPDLKSLTFQGEVSIQIEVGLYPFHMPVCRPSPIRLLNSSDVIYVTGLLPNFQKISFLY